MSWMDNILEGKSSFSLPQVSLPHEPSSSRPCSSGSDKAFNFVETKITYEILKPVKTDDREQIPGLCELMEYKDISYWDRVNTFGISAANWFEVLQEPYRSMQKIWAQMRATPSSEARLRDFTTFLDKQIRNLPWVLLQMIVEYNNYSLDYVSDQIPKFYISFNHLQHRVKYSIARIGGPNENITNLDHFELTPMEFMQSLGGAFSADLHKMCADCTDCAKLISLQESITPLLMDMLNCRIYKYKFHDGMFEDGSCIEFSVEDERKALLHQYRNLWRREMKDKKGKNRTRRLRRLKRHGLGNPNVLFPKDQQPDNFRIIFRIFV